MSLILALQFLLNHNLNYKDGSDVMNTFGNNLKVTIFGESHGDQIGIVIDGLQSGLEINHNLIKEELTKRRPKSIYSTARQETDHYQIISGLYEGKTTGAPLTCLIPNNNKISSDYQNLFEVPRPSHADYPAYIKFKGFNDPRGGGMFSGRVTVAMMIVGAISKQILNQKGIEIGSHILKIHHINDMSYPKTEQNVQLVKQIQSMDFPLIDSTVEEPMRQVILDAKNQEDSVGGIVETIILNLPTGLGNPLFNSFESYFSSLLFSVPAIKGVEFGDGFDLTNHYGSEVNDHYQMTDSKITTTSNHNGGVLGGMTTGMPVIIRTAIKPTPSIGKAQSSVNLKTKEQVMLEIKGRHDPAIVNRVVHVINAVTYYGVLDLLMGMNETEWVK